MNSRSNGWREYEKGAPRVWWYPAGTSGGLGWIPTAGISQFHHAPGNAVCENRWRAAYGCEARNGSGPRPWEPARCTASRCRMTKQRRQWGCSSAKGKGWRGQKPPRPSDEGWDLLLIPSCWPQPTKGWQPAAGMLPWPCLDRRLAYGGRFLNVKFGLDAVSCSTTDRPAGGAHPFFRLYCEDTQG
jgi:hypothetical protein